MIAWNFNFILGPTKIPGFEKRNGKNSETKRKKPPQGQETKRYNVFERLKFSTSFLKPVYNFFVFRHC
jgi:hypothetical protein